MNEWVRVEDAKPESGSEVVVFNGKIMQAVYYWTDPELWFADYSGGVYNVTHWMQPEPPK